MTMTMPLQTDGATASTDVVRRSAPTHLATTAPHPVKELSRILRISLLWDAVVPLVLLPFALQGPTTIAHPVTLMSLTLVACWLVLLTTFGAHDSTRSTVDAGLVRRLTMAGVCFAAVLPALLSTTGNTVEPLRVLPAAALMTAAAVLQRWVVQTRTSQTVRVLVSGHRRVVDRVLTELATDPLSTFEVVGVCGAGTEDPDLSATAHALGAQAVVVVPCRHHDPVSLRRLGWRLERTGVHLLVATGLHDVSRFRTSMEYAGAMPFVRVHPAGLDSGRMKIKSLIDAVLGLMALLVLAPVMLLVAMCIVAESPGPALFRQTRVGKDGTPFTIFKFRTMSNGADKEHARLSAAAGTESVLFKMRADPRVTRVGRVLRLYSLDELPQLINVVRGQMSLVGPRPALPSEVERYERDTHRRLAVKPGITGLWQVSGRSDLSWAHSVRLDLRYVDNWSLSGDLRIVARTFGAVLSHRGAY
jgi:exopolysaccharide biosynthesis polyprenyl glycosylphosphotransferase